MFLIKLYVKKYIYAKLFPFSAPHCAHEYDTGDPSNLIWLVTLHKGNEITKLNT
jgi:hypothetical protein